MTHLIFRAPHLQFAESYNKFDQNLGFESQNMLWGDSMPNRKGAQIDFLSSIQPNHQPDFCYEDSRHGSFGSIVKKPSKGGLA